MGLPPLVTASIVFNGDADCLPCASLVASSSTARKYSQPSRSSFKGSCQFEVFCLVDVCVAPKSRGQGLASSLIAHAEKLAIDNAIDFIILFAPDPRLYQRNGYSHEGNTLRWLKIHEIRTIGIGEEPIPELMVKPLGPTAWPKGTIDLLGPQV